MSKKLEITKVSQSDLAKIANQRGAIRAGSTIDPVRRAGEYGREGYRGEMYAARTTNMKKAEDRLLEGSNIRHNKQGRSNAQEESGHVYVNVGQKRK